jgi:subfamily B ATP-binding cassette protein MsbA
LGLQVATEWAIVKALTPLARRHAWTVAALVALGTAAALTEGVGLGLFIPLFGGLDDPAAAAAIGGRLGAWLTAPFASLAPPLRLRAVLVAIFALLVVRNLLVVAHGALYARLTSRAAHELRRDAFARILHAEDRRLARRDTGAWLNLVESQTWETAAALGALSGIATRLCKVGVFGLGLVALSGRLTLAVGAALAVVSATVRLCARRVDALGRAEVVAWERMAQRLVESLRTLRTIRVFGRESFEQARLESCSDDERRTFERLQRLQALVPPASEFLVAALMLVVLWARVGVPGELPVVLAFLALLYRLHPQVQQLDAARVSLAAAGAPVGAVMAWLDPAETPRVRAGTRRAGRLRTGIAFHEVSFAYAEGLPLALERATLEIRAGVTTALVGPSGAGKSTVVGLLLGLAEPSAGTIAIDGVPLDEIDVASWRARVAVVGQDLPLFDATVAENIAYGGAGTADDADDPADDPAGDPAIVAAAKRADADGFIGALPNGYATRVGDDGVRLSGGQRQRIALARALYRDPDLLVLDEATNAVDGISAGLIERTLVEFGRGRTVLVVSHSAATVEAADDVIVLDAGRVCASGPAARVLAQSALTQRLFARERRRAAGGTS